MPERRRAVDQHVVELTLSLFELVAQNHLAANHAGQLNFNRREVDMRSSNPQVLFLRRWRRPGSLPEIGDASFLGEQIVNRRHTRPRIEPEVERRMRLRIDIDQADALTGASERGAKVHGSRRFTDAALLIDDGDGAHGRGGGWGLGTRGYSRLRDSRRGL